jgi:hypothetical protein
LESDNGCGFVMINCPNKCRIPGLGKVIMMLKREDMQKHLNQCCYLRPYWCGFCGLKDTYEAVTGWGFVIPKLDDDGYAGHQANCPEMPLTCPNKCGMKNIKRKDMEDHRSQCPQEPAQCPFADAGCKVDVCRQQLEDHVTTSLQQHVMLLMFDHTHLKTELSEVKTKLIKAETERDEIKVKLCETEDRLAFCEAMSNPPTKLECRGTSMEATMPSFSEYRRSGKVWYSPPFYYDEGYKMCLAVHANGVGEGAGTHISVEILNIRGKYDDQLEWPLQCGRKHKKRCNHDGCWYLHCLLDKYPAANDRAQIGCQEMFCRLNNIKILCMKNNCLTICIENRDCYLRVEIL